MRDARLKYLLVAPALLVLAGTLAWPLASALWHSLHEWNLARSPSPTAFVGLDHYVTLLGDDPDLWRSARVTLVFTLASVATTLALALALALLLGGPGRLEAGIRTLLVLPFAMSPALVGVSWRFLLNPELGAVAALLGWLVPPLAGRPILADPSLAMVALVLTDAWHWSPYFMLLFVGALAAIPAETIEAAAIDGAGRLRTFRSIVLPQLRAVLAIAVLLKTIFSVKLLDHVVTMTAGGPGTATETLAHLIFQTAFRWYDVGYAAALAWLLAATLAVLAALYGRLARGAAA